MKDPEKFVGNPLNAFLLIKRLTKDWENVKQLLKGRTRKSILNSLANKTKQFMLLWPTDEDFSGAAISLARLQDTYQLSIEDILEGRLANRTFNAQLSAADCFYCRSTILLQ